MTSVKVKFRASSVKGKEGSLFYQVIHRRNIRMVKTGYKVFPEEWDIASASIRLSSVTDEKRLGKLSQNEKFIEQDLNRLNGCISILIRKGIPFSVDDIVRTYKNRIYKDTLNAFMKLIIINMKEQGRIRTAETYNSTLKSFMRFREDKEIFMEEINQDIIGMYETYLKNQGLTLNSISFYMRILRAVYNRAVEQEITMQHFPFRHVYTGIEKTVKRSVTIKTIKCIKELPLPLLSTTDYARDMFIFSFYTRGMSFVDMAYLKKKDLQNGILTYRRKKTGQLLHIKWEKCMQTLLNKYPENPTEYLLPIIRTYGLNERRQYKNALTLINRKLKQISTFVQSPLPLSMYVARHSWASIAKSKHIPISIISEGMGHDSETTTQIYLASLDTAVVDRANGLILKDL